MGSHPLSGLSRLIRIPRSFRELSSRDLLSSRFAPSLAVKPSGNIRQLRLKLPSAGRVIAAYAFSLVLLGAVLVVSYGTGSDNLWPLMMIPLLVAAFYYPRYVYVSMLGAYVVASFAVIAIVSTNKIDKIAITGFFLLSVTLACEVVYRLTTSWERARSALLESEQRFRTLSASAPIGIFQTDAQGMCTYVNAHYLAVTGLTLEQSLGTGWRSALHPEDRETFLENWVGTPSENQDLSYTFRVLTPQGETRWVNVTSAPLLSHKGNFVGQVGTLEDITESKRSAEALQKANDELEERVEQRTVELRLAIKELEQEIAERKSGEAKLHAYANSQTLLLNQLMTAQEAERRRLSMDIHDGPLQSLAVSLIALDRAIRRRERGEDEVADQELRYLRETLASTVEEVRAVLADLNLDILVNYGLEVALRNHIERFSDVTGLEVSLRNSVDRQLPPNIELLMYRLAQESLANVRKHARARQVVISLDIIEDHLHMRIADDGQGLDAEAAFRHNQEGEKLGQKLGLRSMRQRIQAVRGDLTISSAPGQGTILGFSCPV